MSNIQQGSAKKILMVNRVFPPARAPTGRLLYELASALSNEGHDVTILTTGDENDIKRDTQGFEIIRLKTARNSRSFIRNLFVCLRLFFNGLFLPRFDIIVTKTDPPFFVIFGALLAFLKRAKHVHWSQDLYPDILPALDYKVSPWLYRLLDKSTTMALRRCAHIVAISNCMKHELLKKSLRDDKIEIIPNWCDRLLLKDRHTPSQPELPMKFRVLYAGNMGRGHPYHTILGAAEILHKTDKDIEFMFIGKSAALLKLAEERARKGLDNMRFLPFQPRKNLKEVLTGGDLHIITLSEKAVGKMMPSRIYDIFAIKRPCLFIGPETSDLSLMLERLQAGVTLPLDQPELLATAIKHLRDNGQDWHALYNGAAHAAEIYTPAGSIALWTDLINEI